MADPFDKLDGFLVSALNALSPVARKTLFRVLAQEMRKRNQARMTKQTGPDGEKWEPRQRDREGNVRKKAKMLIGLRATRRLMVQANADGGSVSYRGSTARIAAVHHNGLADQVAPGGPRVTYPARPLLGFSNPDIAWLRDRLMEQIAKSLP